MSIVCAFETLKKRQEARKSYPVNAKVIEFTSTFLTIIRHWVKQLLKIGSAAV